MAEKCESGSVYFSSTVTINGCTIKGVALEQNHEPTHRVHITLPWGEKKSYVGMTPGSCNFYYTDGHAILCKVCLDKVDRYTCYYTVCRTVEAAPKQSFIVEDDKGVGVNSAYVKVAWYGGSSDGYTDGNGVVALKVDPLFKLNAYASKSGYECYNTYCDRCVSNKCYRDNFTHLPTASMRLGLKKEVAPEYCWQNVRVVTSDGAGVYPTIYWGEGSSSYGGKTPCDETHKYEKGKRYTIRATARGYKDASRTITACETKFTLTLTKGVAPACDTYTTKSSCEAAGCFWYNNSCHKYGPVKCSDYMDALTCVANNCYWWSDGTCHDTEEAPPISAYEECGRAPTSSDSKAYITNWWKCAYLVGEKRGVCVARWSQWAKEVRKDIKKELGSIPYFLSESGTPDGDYVKIGMGDTPEIYLGRFKWKCPPVVKKYTINVLVKYQDAKPLAGAYVDIDKYVAGVWKEVSCSETVITKGTCSTDTFAGDKDNIKTDYNGKVSFTLPFLPGGIPNKYGFRVGKVGYLNKKWHEDWTDRKETEPQPAPQGGTYDFVFSLTDATIANKFIVHTVGFKEGDKVSCVEAYDWSKCFVFKPTGVKVTKTPSSYPDDTVEFTEADGFKPGMTCGIGPIINIAWKWDYAMGPTWCGEFKGLKEPVISRYGPAGMVCDFFGIDPTSDECRRFLAEFLDPVYVANIITGVTKGEDIYGAPYNPSKFEIALFPVVLVCSVLPMVPGAKVSKFLGRAIKIGKKTSKVANYFEADYVKIYRATMYGDDARLAKWRAAIEAEDVVEARRIMNDIIANPAITDADAIKRVKVGLDELDDTITNKVKVGSNANDLKSRMVSIADEYADPDIYVKSMDDAYSDYITVMQRGTRDKATDVFVKAAVNVCSPAPWKCKFSVLNATGKLKVGKEELDLLDITKILKEHDHLKESDLIYRNCFRGLADLDETDVHNLNFAINSGLDDQVVTELYAHSIKVPDKKCFDWLLHHNEWALEKWGRKWAGISHGSGFGREFWRSTWAGIKNSTPWRKKADDIADVLTDAELEKLFDEGTLNKIAKNLDAEGRYIDAGELLRYVVRKDPEFFKRGYANALMKTFEHFDDATEIAKHIKPLSPAGAASRRTWFKGIKSEFERVLGKNRGDEVFKKLGLDAIEETSDLNKAFYTYGKGEYDKVFARAVSTGASDEQAKQLAKIALEAKIDIASGFATGTIKTGKGLTGRLYSWAMRHKILSSLIGGGAFCLIWYAMDNLVMNVMMGRKSGVIEKTFGDQLYIVESKLKQLGYAIRDRPCDSVVQQNYINMLTELKRLKDISDATGAIDSGKIAQAKELYATIYGISIGNPNEFMRNQVDVAWSSALNEYTANVRSASCMNPLVPPGGWPDDVFMPELAEEIVAKVEKVIDGDTLEVKSFDFRFKTRVLGINTPEGKKEGYLVRRMATIDGTEERWQTDKDLYDKIKTWTTPLLWHVNVTLKSDSSRQWDNYQRFLAVVNKNSLDVGKKELELGYAPVYFYDANKQVNTSAYLAAEKIAKDANLGVWRFFGDTGTIRCISSPETAVDVYVDSELEPRGKTVSNVFLMERVSVGAHTITFKKYVSGKLHSCTTSVRVLKDRTVEATCEMISEEEPEVPILKGKMHCKTFKPDGKTLSNAKIYVTGGKYSNTYMGDTEKTLTIETGTYTVRYTHPDYTDDCVKTNVVVSTVGISDAVCQFTDGVVPPEEEEAVWHITEAKDAITGAAITRAKVYVDDVYIHGWAPEDITFCAGCKCDTYVDCGFGTHTVKVVKDDKEWTKTRDLKAGDDFTDTPLLEELAAITVTFKSAPEGATVRIDGKLISLYRLTGALKRVKTLGY